jgi:hypothetical protein
MSLSPELLIQGIKLDLITVANLDGFLEPSTPASAPRQLVDWSAMDRWERQREIKRIASSGARADLGVDPLGRYLVDSRTGRLIPPPPRRRKAPNPRGVKRPPRRTP